MNEADTLRQLRRFARRLACAELAGHDIVFPAVDPVLVQRPQVAGIRGAGVVVREHVRWSA
jgi:hypothetical protein